jgi:hypothetical protein
MPKEINPGKNEKYDILDNPMLIFLDSNTAFESDLILVG